MATVTASQARASLPALLDRVQAGDEVTITRHGRPVAVVVRPDALRVRRAEGALASASALHEALASARRSDVPSAGLREERAEALIDDVRAGRARR